MRKIRHSRESGNLGFKNWTPAFAGATMLLLLFVSTIRAEATHAFPVPFVPSKGHSQISFTPLPVSGSIKIYTIDGQEVRSLSINPGDTIKSWDAKNGSGKSVATGVYLFLVMDGDKKLSDGKLVIIR